MTALEKEHGVVVHYEDYASSSSDNTYRALKYADGFTSCNCPGWSRRTNSAGGRECKHTRFIGRHASPVQTGRIPSGITEHPLPPQGEEWHNPNNVSFSRVEWEDGWRLITKSERRGAANEKRTHCLEGECDEWDEWGGSGWNDNGYCGILDHLTYRTKVPFGGGRKRKLPRARHHDGRVVVTDFDPPPPPSIAEIISSMKRRRVIGIDEPECKP